MRANFLSLTLALLCALTSPAFAQVQTSRRVAAEALFDSGLLRMREGKFAEGCAQLEQSLELDRAVGAMMYLAECYERLDRVASAWLMFREAASQARAEGQMERWHTSDQRALQLEPKLPRLVVQVDPGNTMPGLEITLNGMLVPSKAWGVPLPVDPGDSQLEVRAPGYRGFSAKQSLVANGETVVVQVPGLSVAPREISAPPAVSSSSPPSATQVALSAQRQHQQLSDEPSSRSWQKPVAIGSAGVGIVALGLGTYFGLYAVSRNDAAEKLCPSSDNICDDARGLSFSRDANDAANLSNVFLIGGGVLAAAGIVLWLTAPSQDEAAVGMHVDGREVALRLAGVF